MGDSAGTGYHLRVMPRPAKDWVIAVFWVVGIREIWEKRAQTPPNHVQSHMKSNAKSSASYFTSNETLLYSISYQIRPYPLWVELYLFHRYSGIGAMWGNWPQIPQCMCWDTWKAIQSLQLLVSRQMRPYSSVIALWGLGCTCFTGTRVLGEFRKTGTKYPKSGAGTHEK